MSRLLVHLVERKPADLTDSILAGMFASGIRAGLEAIKLYDSYEIIDGEVVGPAPVKLTA